MNPSNPTPSADGFVRAPARGARCAWLQRLADWYDRSVERGRVRELERELAQAPNARALSQRLHRAEASPGALVDF
jgi:hypothetical protein